MAKESQRPERTQWVELSVNISSFRVSVSSFSGAQRAILNPYYN